MYLTCNNIPPNVFALLLKGADPLVSSTGYEIYSISGGGGEKFLVFYTGDPQGHARVDYTGVFGTLSGAIDTILLEVDAGSISQALANDTL